MKYFIETFLFILNKWDLSLDEFNLFGKIMFYIPNYINNILVQIWYFLLFPIIMLVVYLRSKIEFLYLLNSLLMIQSSK